MGLLGKVLSLMAVVCVLEGTSVGDAAKSRVSQDDQLHSGTGHSRKNWRQPVAGRHVKSDKSAVVTPLDACGAGAPDSLTNYTGSFQSPNYPSGYPGLSQCSWLMTSQETTGVVMLEFTSFHINPSDDVYVYDGNDTSSPVIALYYDEIDPPPAAVYSNQPDMLVVLDSKYDVSTFPGFNALYTSDSACRSARNLSDSEGTFSSPFYPQTYTTNKRCQWVITLDSAELAEVEFVEFDVGSRLTNDSCVNAYVEVYQGAVLHSRLCGSTTPPVLRLYSAPSLVFFTDSTQPTEGQGFEAQYRIMEVYTTAEALTTTTSTTTSTTTTTVPPISTTIPGLLAPDITPNPFIKLTLNGTLTAVDPFTDIECARGYSEEFQKSLRDTLDHLNADIVSGQMCPDIGDVVTALAGSSELVTVGNIAWLTFVVRIYPSEETTVRDVELCGWNALIYLQDFDNWPQTIIHDVYGCQSVTFNPMMFDSYEIAWGC